MDRTAGPDVLLPWLAQTVATFDAIGRSLPAALLSAPPEPGQWSPNEILWHVRAVADVYGEHALRILNEDLPAWRHVSPRARMKKARYDQIPFAESLSAFQRQRADLTTLLDGLAPEAWQRVALVQVDAKESRLSLQERIWVMAAHEESHCAQAEQLAASLGRA